MQTQPKPIQLTDWHRILAGGTPWEFLLEVVLRAAFTYLLLMVAMRLPGKRVAAYRGVRRSRERRSTQCCAGRASSTSGN